MHYGHVSKIQKYRRGKIEGSVLRVNEWIHKGNKYYSVDILQRTGDTLSLDEFLPREFICSVARGDSLFKLPGQTKITIVNKNKIIELVVTK